MVSTGRHSCHIRKTREGFAHSLLQLIRRVSTTSYILPSIISQRQREREQEPTDEVPHIPVSLVHRCGSGKINSPGGGPAVGGVRHQSAHPTPAPGGAIHTAAGHAQQHAPIDSFLSSRRLLSTTNRLRFHNPRHNQIDQSFLPRGFEALTTRVAQFALLLLRWLASTGFPSPTSAVPEAFPLRACTACLRTPNADTKGPHTGK
jgi:hypothetical protein